MEAGKGRKFTFSFKSASETGFAGRVAGTGGGAIDVSGIFFLPIHRQPHFHYFLQLQGAN